MYVIETCIFVLTLHQVKEHFYHHNVDKDKESLRNEVTKVKKQIASGEHIALHQRSELQKLTRIIQEADEERQRQASKQDAPIYLYARSRKTHHTAHAGVVGNEDELFSEKQNKQTR